MSNHPASPAVVPQISPGLSEAAIQAPSSDRKYLLAIGFASVLWGSSFLFGKLALAEWPASYVILFRFTAGSTLLLPFAWPHFRTLHRSDAPLFALSGLLMVPVMMLLQFEGLDRTNATSSALIIGTIPVMMALAAVVFDRERLKAKGWAAVVLSTLGAGLLAGSTGAGRTLTGDALVFASAVAAVAWVLVMRRLLNRYEPLTATSLCMGIGALWLIPVALWRDGLPPTDLQPVTWGALIALSVLCTALTYSLWNWGLKHVATSRAAPFVNLEPAVGAMLGLTVLHEPFTLMMLLGGFLVLAAAVLVSTSK